MAAGGLTRSSHGAGSGPFGKNFVKTMLRLAGEREELGVVADQYGSPTSALDIADGIIAVSRNLLEKPDDRSLRGLFHMTGTGFASWSDFAAEIFSLSAKFGGPSARVRPSRRSIPYAGRRPANSRLDCTKLKEAWCGSPPWRQSLEPCVKRLIEETRKEVARGRA